MTQILSTTRYSDFNEIISNREVDLSHAKRLAKAIDENDLLHLNPIIVNSSMEVIDGQHRLEAAKMLGKDIYYVVDDNVSKEHIAKLNSNQKNWKALDYLNYYCVEKNPEYLNLSQFVRKWPMIAISTLITLLTGDKQRKMIDFREGHLKITKEEEAYAVLNLVDKIRNMGVDFAYDRNLILAISDCLKTEGFDSEQLLTKLEGNRMGLVKCINKKQYLQSLEEIYNRHMQKRLRFF